MVNKEQKNLYFPLSGVALLNTGYWLVLLVWTGIQWCRFWPRVLLGGLDIAADFLERHLKHLIRYIQ